MFVNDKINENNRKMFFDNIVYVFSIDVIFVFVTRFKKKKYVWNMYKKSFMNKIFETMICNLKKRYKLFLLKYRFAEKFVNAIQTHKNTIAKMTLWNWYFKLNHYRFKISNHFEKINKIKIIQKKHWKLFNVINAQFSRYIVWYRQNRQQEQRSFFKYCISIQSSITKHLMKRRASHILLIN